MLSPWFWAGGAFAFLIFPPNLLWNIQHHFPFLELQANIRRGGRDVALSPLTFFGQEILAMLPMSVPVWLAGLWYLFFRNEGKRFRALGWAFVVTAGVIVALSPAATTLFPAFPMLFAAGSVAWERWLASIRGQWVKPVYVTLMVLMGALPAPTLIPLLPPETYIRYAAATHLQQPRIENTRLGPLPQLFADQFGWEEMAAAVAGAYNRLPPDVRAKNAVFGQSYGQAGAHRFFWAEVWHSRRYSNQRASELFSVGPPRLHRQSMIVMDDRPERLAEIFTTCRKVARVWHRYSMPYQHFDVYYCEGMKQP